MQVPQTTAPRRAYRYARFTDTSHSTLASAHAAATSRRAAAGATSGSESPPRNYVNHRISYVHQDNRYLCLASLSSAALPLSLPCSLNGNLA